ncbi:MAG: right-handed parallel beta-helix repeat-containing protein [Anaerolineales bacterium]
MNNMQNIRFKVLTFAILIGLIANALWTVPAFADSGFTNPTPPTSGSGSTRGAHSSSNNLSNVPSGTKIVIVDSNGNKLALGSQAAQDIINSGDPIWCPATLAAPTPGNGGCTIQYTVGGLYALVSDINSGTITLPLVNGTIWIQQGSDSSSADIILNGSSLPLANQNIKNFSLTLKGGWVGCSGLPCPSTISGTSTFNHEISITNWNNAVTLSNITITVPAITGLVISASKNITLTNVDSNGNGSYGASLDTSYNSGTGSITITNSQFNNNLGGDGAALSLGTGGAITISGTTFNSNTSVGADGLDITSSTGAITLTNVTTDSNGNYGAYIYNNSSTHAAVTLNGDTFNSNINNNGLAVNSQGAILANDLTVSGNGTTISSTGAILDNNNTSAIGGVTLTGVNIFDGNGEDGLEINSYGAIKVNSLIAYDNKQSGVDLSNYSVTPLVTQSVTLTGSSQFNDNGSDGLDVDSNGLTTANNITAISNGGNGVAIYNAFTGIKAGVTLTGTNIFNSNQVEGLRVISNGAILLNSITADNNDISMRLYYGADIDTSGGTSASSVTLTGVNTFDGNYDTGLNINSAGAVTVASITADNSQTQWGTYIVATGAVTLTGSNTFNSNKVNGLSVSTRGAITTNNLTANGNGQDGVSLDNCNYTSSCTTPTAQSITMNGVNTFDSNMNDGLWIASKGSVTTNNLTANCNGFSGVCGGSSSGNIYGVFINNCQSNGSCTGNGTVTISGTNNFNENYAGGLNIQSRGAITLNSITASFNTIGYGISVENTDGGTASPQTITLTGTNVFNDNYFDGAYLHAYGAITASNVTADWNGTSHSSSGTGLLLSQSGGTSPAAMSLSDTNVFTGNYDNGLEMDATGAITASNVTANGNDESGIQLDNYDWLPSSSSGITMTNLSASNNSNDGFYIRSNGVITSSTGLIANSNGSLGFGYGADIQDLGSTHPALTLNGTNTFNNNQEGGLNVNDLGAVTVNNLQASNNSAGYGAYIYTGSVAVASAVTLTGFGIFNNNHDGGLDIYNYGTITTNNLTADSNPHGYGAELNNSSAGTPQKIAMNGTNSFNNNYDGGLSASSIGAISLSNVTASNSTAGDGVYLYNVAGTPAGITVSGNNIANNNSGGNGFNIQSTGSIVLNNIIANGNAHDGAWLQNDLGSAGITITGVNSFSDNSANGIETYTNGNIALTQTAFDGNSGTGLFVHNSTFNFTVTMTCGSFTNNADGGIALSQSGDPITAIHLTGVVFSGNTAGDFDTGTTPLTQTRDCPLP